jgi:ribosomal protein S18 acetylase RimI-like enzyme
MTQYNGSRAKTVPNVTLRPVTSEDRGFLLRVYAASREIELSMVPWSDEQKLAFVEHQFAAQTAYYATEFPRATHDIILFSDQPAGRFYVDRNADRITILDITVLPEHRRQRVGTTLIEQLLNESRETGRPVHVCIESFNPSQNLFKRLRFTVTESDNVNLRLAWRHGMSGPPV